MKNNPSIYTMAKAIEYPRKIIDTHNRKSTRAYDKQIAT